jgi:RNA polymerase sigma-70 factor (ECF subfamily)
VATDVERLEESSMEPFDDIGHAAQPNPEGRASERELVGFLERAVDGLPDIYRMVFVLREVEGLSTLETAQSLDISEDLVKVRLHRARAELRRVMEAGIGHAQRDLFAFHLSRCDRVVNAVLARITAT